MKWHAARPREGREGGRQIQERSDGQARVSLTCRALAVGWAESCQEVSGWPGCNHGTQILTLITGEGGEGQRSKRNLPHFAHLLPTTLARRRERRSLTSPLPGPPSLFRARVPKCFPPGTLSSHFSAHPWPACLFIRRGSQTPAGEGRTAVPRKGKAWERFPFQT